LWAIFAVALACSVSPIAYSQSIPTLNALTRSSGATVSPGSTASFTVSYTLGSSAVTFAQVNVSDASGTNRNFVMGTPTSGGTVSSSVDSSWLNGAYTVNYVAFSDSTGRITFYYRDRRIVASPTLSGAPTAHSINLAAQDFQVSSGTTTLPIVALQPSSQTAVVGGSAMFSVSVMSASTLSYQWRKDGASISGATNASLVLSNVQTASAGDFTVVVTNSAGSVTSSVATLSFSNSTGGVAPIFTTQPTNATSGDGGSFSVNVQVGTSNFSSVTWRINFAGRTLGASASATSQANNFITASLAFGPVTLADAGPFQVVATNDYGSTLSAARTLSVTPSAPSISTQPANQTVLVGSQATFSVSATGSSALSYQWSKNSVAINGATNATYTLAAVAMADAGSYICTVTNSVGSTTSSAATLTVNPVVAPSITTQPISTTVTVGNGVTFSAVVSGTAPLSYQWRKDGATILGATSGTVNLPNVQPTDAGSYTVVVGNAAGNTTSNAAALTVNVSAAISTQPISQTVNAGATATLTVAANGTAPLSYQWRKNGASISGATSGALTLTNVQPTDAGSYAVVVGNVAGNTTSNAATLTVNVPAAISAQPISQTVNAGTAATFTVAATGAAPLTYQWRKDGTPILGATIATFTLSSVQPTDAAAYTVVISNPAGSSTSNAAILAVTIPNPGRLINLSVLTDIATAGDDFTLGYVVGGSSTSGAKPLVIRAAGPSLGALGVPGTLDDPKLELFARSTKTSENDNWGGSPQLTTALAAVGAFAYTGPASKDAAATASITTRDNSVRVSAAGSGTGAVIAEIYDATPAASFTTATPRLINVSVRKHLGSGLTMGFVVGGATPAKVLVRGIGPTLGAFGVPGTVVDPQLTLFNSSSVKIGENNDWAGTAELTAAFANVGAFALPATSKDAALLVTLAPGNYTAQVTGVNGTTGVALVEVYEVP
jgi:hypothetical protein